MIADLLRLRGITANASQKADARSLIIGAILGMVASGWGWLYPWGRLIRGVLTTAIAESMLNRDAVGDDGASVGILQFNDVRADLLRRRDWRKSPFWSGYAVASYLAATDARTATLRPGLSGLAAWRSVWVRGQVLDATDQRDVGAIALIMWENIGQRYAWLTVVQFVLFGAAVVFLPILAVPILAIVAVGWLRS